MMVLVFNVSICDFTMTDDFIITQSTKKHCHYFKVIFSLIVCFDCSSESTKKFEVNIFFNKINFCLTHQSYQSSKALIRMLSYILL